MRGPCTRPRRPALQLQPAPKQPVSRSASFNQGSEQVPSRAFRSSRRRLPELEDGLGQFVRAFLREKVTAAFARARDRAPLHAISDAGNRRAKCIAHPFGSSERQNRHCQSLGRARLCLREAVRIEVCPVPGETSAHGSGRGILTRIFFEGGRIYRVGSKALRREDKGKVGLLVSLDQDLL